MSLTSASVTPSTPRRAAECDEATGPAVASPVDGRAARSLKETHVRPLHWTDLKRGDRIRHFDYGRGTIDAAGPVWLLITWDDPAVEWDFHTSEIAKYLERVPANLDVKQGAEAACADQTNSIALPDSVPSVVEDLVPEVDEPCDDVARAVSQMPADLLARWSVAERPPPIDRSLGNA